MCVFSPINANFVVVVVEGAEGGGLINGQWCEVVVRRERRQWEFGARESRFEAYNIYFGGKKVKVL